MGEIKRTKGCDIKMKQGESGGQERGTVQDVKWASGGENGITLRGEVGEKRRAEREIEGGDLERLRE